jgi:hypothetical protein
VAGLTPDDFLTRGDSMRFLTTVILLGCCSSALGLKPDDT